NSNKNLHNIIFLYYHLIFFIIFTQYIHHKSIQMYITNVIIIYMLQQKCRTHYFISFTCAHDEKIFKFDVYEVEMEHALTKFVSDFKYDYGLLQCCMLPHLRTWDPRQLNDLKQSGSIFVSVLLLIFVDCLKFCDNFAPLLTFTSSFSGFIMIY
ncbi:hypothetical protein ACJX0J_039911, partial [Zea mays]